MEGSITDGIYISTFVFIFIILLSAALYLFNMINHYADVAFEFGKVANNDSVIENSMVKEKNILTGAEVYAYYLNYETSIKKNEDGNDSHNFKYNFKFKGITDSSVKDLDIDKISLNKKYFLEYGEFTNEKVDITVVELE